MSGRQPKASAERGHAALNMLEGPAAPNAEHSFPLRACSPLVTLKKRAKWRKDFAAVSWQRFTQPIYMCAAHKQIWIFCLRKWSSNCGNFRYFRPEFGGCFKHLYVQIECGRLLNSLLLPPHLQVHGQILCFEDNHTVCLHIVPSPVLNWTVLKLLANHSIKIHLYLSQKTDCSRQKYCTCPCLKDNSWSFYNIT